MPGNSFNAEKYAILKSERNVIPCLAEMLQIVTIFVSE
jgi:hypothetical protein